MLEILKMQPLISNIDLSDAHIVHLTLLGIPAKAMDYRHSICIGVFFIERKIISDTAIRYITLMMVALEDTQDFALQLNDGYWWLWGRYTIDNKETLDDRRKALSIKLEQIHAVIQHLNSLVTTMNSSKTSVLTKQGRDANRVIS
ncbi:hypothetical protein [Yersinia pekkanenii]|uniref:Secretion system apparatus protein B n=1 Tax=Yersinia pekkanenii TaxID=1288385 RepID=A0A0T9QR69_9GAMM|nr:hypothetical protein [Yersinia pekkanenii]CNI24562.1 Secretion system apparatus protein B [Yersinia pekkanenii]CRY68891.1 Secretion system apparatus protein B [Yersinia pekkanenii]